MFRRIYIPQERDSLIKIRQFGIDTEEALIYPYTNRIDSCFTVFSDDNNTLFFREHEDSEFELADGFLPANRVDDEFLFENRKPKGEFSNILKRRADNPSKTNEYTQRSLEEWNKGA